MGSKRVSAPKIINLIKAYYPNNKDFYDVFCGGFAISEWALQKGFNVYASDFNKQVIELYCSIGDTEIDGVKYSDIVEIARAHIQNLGGFEKLAEWGLV